MWTTVMCNYSYDDVEYKKIDRFKKSVLRKLLLEWNSSSLCSWTSLAILDFSVIYQNNSVIEKISPRNTTIIVIINDN